MVAGHEKELIIKILKKAISELGVKLKDEEISKVIEIPPNNELGDFAFPCFSLASKLKEAPHEIALEIREKISLIPEEFEDVEVLGPYINFFLNKKNLAENVLSKILSQKENYGKPEIKEKKKIMVEFSQPNTHKAFHVGHIRGTSLGESISRILEFCGNKIFRANYSGDTGAHVAKWLWCYTKFHSKEKLRDDEKWIASIYVDAVKRLKANEKLQEQIDAMNWALESKKNKKLNALWKKTRKLSIDSWKNIYKDLDVNFNLDFYESDMEKRAREISHELKDKKIAVKSDDAIIMNLKKFNLGVWILLRKDGTPLYSAKDLALAELKLKKYKADKYLVLVADEQRLHFEQLCKTLDLMKLAKRETYDFLTFGLVRLPTGKMSSRTGENILYSDFIKEISDFAKSEIKKRGFKTSKTELEKRALKISIASIKYSMLKQSPRKNIIFSKEEALNFEGDSGAYLLYSYARGKSILRKVKNPKKAYSLVNLEEQEKNLIKTLSQFPEIVSNAEKNLSPALIANYSYKLSQNFNEFYHSCPVINSEKESFRIDLVKSFLIVLETALNLLGIGVVEKM